MSGFLGRPDSTDESDSEAKSESLDSMSQDGNMRGASNPSEHLQQALLGAAAGVPNFATLTTKQYEAFEFMATDPEAWKRKVVGAVGAWSQEKRQQNEYLEGFRESLAEEVRATVGKIDPFLLREMIKTSGHVDEDYVNDFLTGFPVSGVVDAKGTGSNIDGGQLTHGKPANGKRT